MNVGQRLVRGSWKRPAPKEQKMNKLVICDKSIFASRNLEDLLTITGPYFLSLGLELPGSQTLCQKTTFHHSILMSILELDSYRESGVDHKKIITNRTGETICLNWRNYLLLQSMSLVRKIPLICELQADQLITMNKRKLENMLLKWYTLETAATNRRRNNDYEQILHSTLFGINNKKSSSRLIANRRSHRMQSIQTKVFCFRTNNNILANRLIAAPIVLDPNKRKGEEVFVTFNDQQGNTYSDVFKSNAVVDYRHNRRVLPCMNTVRS